MYRITTQPATEPVTVTEAKAHLKVEHTADDDLITALIQAARQEAELLTGRGFITQTVTEVFDRFPAGGDPIRLSIGPLIAVTGITYTSEAGDTTTVSTSTYVVHTYQEPPVVTLANSATWPTPLQQAQVVRVTYTVGYGDASAVPAAIKQAMLLTLAHWYENRTDSVRRMPTQAEFLLFRYRIWTQ